MRYVELRAQLFRLIILGSRAKGLGGQHGLILLVPESCQRFGVLLEKVEVDFRNFGGV